MVLLHIVNICGEYLPKILRDPICYNPLHPVCGIL